VGGIYNEEQTKQCKMCGKGIENPFVYTLQYSTYSQLINYKMAYKHFLCFTRGSFDGRTAYLRLTSIEILLRIGFFLLTFSKRPEAS
jgi:hypothetical protein